MKPIEELSKKEVLGLIYKGYRKSGIMSGSPAVPLKAFLAGLEVEGKKFVDWHERSQVSQGCEKVLKKFDIPDTYVPPRVLVRHALALMVAFNDTIKQLEVVRGESVTDTVILQHGWKFVGHWDGAPAGAYQISDEDADHLLETIFRRNLGGGFATREVGGCSE